MTVVLVWMTLMLWNILSRQVCVNISTDVEVLWVSLQHLRCLKMTTVLWHFSLHLWPGLFSPGSLSFDLAFFAMSELWPVYEFSWKRIYEQLIRFCLNLLHKILSVGNGKKCSAILHEVAKHISSSASLFSLLRRGNFLLGK